MHYKSYANSSFASDTNIVDAMPKVNTAIIAMMEPVSAQPHLLLCRANTPPAKGNAVSKIDNTRRIISMLLIRGAIKGSSAGGMTSKKSCQVLVAVIAIIRPIALIAPSAPVMTFKIPAVIGFQVFFTVVSISTFRILVIFPRS